MMGKTINFFFNHKYLSLILLTIVIAGIVFFGLSPKKTDPPVVTKTRIDSVILGKSSREDVIKLLGNPVEEKQVGRFDVLTFDSASPTRPDQVFLTENTAKLTKEIISYKDGRKATEIKNQYGLANYILYGEDSTAGFYLFVYPDRGISYLGNPNSDDLLEIWHFSPTDIKAFQREFAVDYSENPPSPIQ